MMAAAGICYSCGRERGAEGLVISDGREAIDGLEGTAGAPGGAGWAGASGSADASEADGAGGSRPASDPGLSENLASAGQQETKPLIYVHICGAVKEPGVYELEEGSRVFQAVETAGGFSEDAAADYLNMADLVADGMKLAVPTREEVENGDAGSAYGPGALTGGGGSAGQGIYGGAAARVNINTAGREELMTLKGIGEARAEDIIRYRENNGKFQKIEDIMNVSGIKDAAFEKIRDDITV